MPLVQYTLTAEQRHQVEQSWSKALFSHAEKLTLNFTRSVPDQYQEFSDFRANDWKPAFDSDWNKARTGWEMIANRNRSTDYNRLRELYNGFAILNSASLDMVWYLQTGDKKYLGKARKQLGKIEAIEKHPEG